MTSNKDQDKWKKFSEERADEAPAEKDLSYNPEPGLEFPSHEKLEAQLTEMEQQVEKYKDEALRAKAEMQNVLRRTERDVQNAHKYGIEKLLNDLLPVVDSLERGLESGAKDDPMREGLEMTLSMLEKALEKHGIEVLDPKEGDVFNADQHQAMSMQPDPKAKPNTILKVMQRGYGLNGRVLRPAMVVVAA